MERRYWNINLEEMMEAGVHFGHGTKKWNPKMAPYISAKRKGIHITNLTITARFLSEACDLVFDAASGGKKLLIVGTKNKGIYVSRVGSAAQIKATKKVAGKSKLELAKFAELEAFEQFASDLDKATQNQLARGQRLRELLKQSQSEPLAVEDQVAIIYTRTDGYLDVLEIGQVKRFIIGLRTYLTKNKPKFQEILSSTKIFTEEAEILLIEAI
ncbi:hypothetical protein KSP40_PGU005233 [Platanthera guangdongensis]|uniref:30S ribosomal protein S2, chloroplastic n=1 Tax=Platanthera guangdongensis TaxID=2320717 RepID=A0ABR2LPQ7_9ASPA